MNLNICLKSKKGAVTNSQKVKNSSLLSKFLNDKKLRIRYKSGNSLCSNTPEFARLILFDFLSKISIRNSLIFLLWDWNFNFATAPFYLYIVITCQPIMFLELHKCSFNIIGRRSNLILKYWLLIQKKF